MTPNYPSKNVAFRRYEMHWWVVDKAATSKIGQIVDVKPSQKNGARARQTSNYYQVLWTQSQHLSWHEAHELRSATQMQRQAATINASTITQPSTD